jgi:HD-GYP domain-containing protein (c-di-GMP phosphodiesterase class II)
MRRERPYASALDQRGALAEIRRGAGTQFDPQLVDLFLSVVERERTTTIDEGEQAQAVRDNLANEDEASGLTTR